MEKKERNRKVVVGIISGVITAILIMGVTAGVYAQRMLNVPTIHPHVTVQGIAIHDLLPEVAKQKLKAQLETELEDRRLNLILNDQEWSASFRELGFHYFYEEALEKAMNFGRSGGVVSRLNAIKELRAAPVHLLLNHDFDESLLEAFVARVAEEVYVAPEAAGFERRANGFHVEPEVPGRELDKADAFAQAVKVLLGENTEPVQLSLYVLSAYPTAADLNQIETVISEFSTTFNAGEVGRAANLRLGSSSIDGILLLPGDEFSFNETTGPRVASAGYQEAPVIIRGELVPGIGGGICQVSTTLYNAVVRADLFVVERTNHSLPVSYVPLGHDATVAFNLLDFRFRNNQQAPIFLESEVRGNRITVRIFGKNKERPDIDLVSRVVQVVEPTTETRYDHGMYVDEKRVEREAKPGFRVVTYKVYREGGREVRREEITRDNYRPVNGIVIRGTKPRVSNDWMFQPPVEPPEAFYDTPLENLNG